MASSNDSNNVNIIFKGLSGELLQMTVDRDDNLKTVAQKLVISEPQLFKCASFVRINRFNISNSKKWEEGEVVSVLYDPQPQIYEIHDNGGIPFVVEVRDDTICIYYAEQDDQNEDGYGYGDEYKIVKGEMITETSYEKVWIGDNDNDFNTNGYTEKDIYPGNSILVHLSHEKYMYIGSEIYEFNVQDGDQIEKYFSPVGNNDVPYPYAIGKKMVYFMLEKNFVPIETIDINLDCYTQLYENNQDNLPDFKDFKIIQERTS